MFEAFDPFEAETDLEGNVFQRSILKPCNGFVHISDFALTPASLAQQRKAALVHTRDRTSSGRIKKRMPQTLPLVPETPSKYSSRTKKLEASMWDTQTTPSTMEKIYAHEFFLPMPDQTPNTFPILKNDATLYRHEATIKLAADKKSVRELYSDVYLEPKPDIDYTFVINILNLFGKRYERERWKRWGYLRDGRERFHLIHAKLWRWHVKVDDAKVWYKYLHGKYKQAAAGLTEVSSTACEEVLTKKRRELHEMGEQLKRQQTELTEVLLPTFRRQMENRKTVFLEYEHMKHAFLQEDGVNLRFLAEAIVKAQKKQASKYRILTVGVAKESP